MSKDHYQHYYQESADSAYLLIDLPTGKKEMHLKTEGNPVVLAKMIAKAMDAKQEICAAFIAGIVFWCNENNVDLKDLKAMVKFHG